ncbi:TraB/GumN family protein [Sideroxydans sp. CL21]|uniref:TraB/GumN family protein n=1 Tax=Sideroxydans sp. CL21 TaxID=2600596 RepID=UPI0024BC54AB|nr:TraB/GumN family protein [Sideroxydans sp. CL21]
MSESIRLVIFAALVGIANPACVEAATCPPAVEQPTPEMVRAAMHNARDHGFLWRISKDGRTSYLYGTMHVGKFDWTFPGPHVAKALRATDTLALELDFLDPDIRNRVNKGMATQRVMALPAQLEKRLREQAEAVCIPYDALARLTPEFQIATLTLMVGRWDGLDASYAIDAILAGIGHGAKKEVVSLETPESQLQLLQMQDEQETVTFVRESLDELETGRERKLLKRLSRVWAAADYPEMEHYSEWCDCMNTENERELMKRILDDRNPKLADRIDALHMGGKRVFAAVGSLHMFGATGLPMLMSKHGYVVERIELKSQ